MYWQLIVMSFCMSRSRDLPLTSLRWGLYTRSEMRLSEIKSKSSNSSVIRVSALQHTAMQTDTYMSTCIQTDIFQYFRTNTYLSAKLI